MGPPTVVVEEMTLSDITPSFEFVGRAEAVSSVELRARVEGFLEARNFLEGTPVAKDTPLFVIEKAPYEITLQQRQADLAGARATLANAQSDFDRKAALLARNTVSQATVDQARATLGSAQAAVQLAEAAVARAELDLTYTEVKSPIDGVISAAAYDVGNLVNPGSGPLATVTSVDPIHVTIEVSDRDMVQVRRQGLDLENPPVAPTLILSDGRRYPHEGEFNYLAPSVNPNTDTITSRAVFPNPGGLLLPGQLVSVAVSQKEPIRAFRVAQSAVQEDREGYFVLVVTANDTVAVKRISVEIQIENDWLVSQGLEPGDRVIVRGLQKARIGEPVNAVTDGA